MYCMGAFSQSVPDHCSAWIKPDVGFVRYWLLHVNGKQWPGTNTIRNEILPAKPKWEITEVTNKHEPRYEKTGFLHMRKQRRRSASR